MRTRRSIGRAGLVSVLLVATAVGCGGGGGGGGDEPIPVVDIVSVRDDSPVIIPIGDEVPALVRFSLAYLNGDHHVSALSVGAAQSVPGGSDLDTFVLRLDDGDTGLNNPRDPVDMSATYIDVQAFGPARVTSGFDLSGVAQLPLDPPIEPDQLFVLSGFSFRTDGPNHHLRILRITPFPDLGYVEVEYRDDSPDDDLYAASVAYVVLPATPAPPGFIRYDFDGPHEESFPFLGGGSRDRLPGTAVLHGFRLEFRDGDRHLNDVAIDLDSASRIFARLADGDTGSDDFVDARVSYVLVSR